MQMIERAAIHQENPVRRRHHLFRGTIFVIAALVALSCGCKKPSEQAGPGPRSFASPESTGNAVYEAAKAGNRDAILAIFGLDAKDLVLTTDPAEDKRILDTFAAAYERMHRWGKLEGGGLILIVGIRNYPFPFPLIKNAEGTWSFDREAARKEILARQIGSNELTVLDVLNEMAAAQTEYHSALRDGSKVKRYAQKIISSEGKHDGLYWKAAVGEAESPLGPLAARASAEGYKGTRESPEPFHGYFYRILRQQGPHARGGPKNYLSGGQMTGGFAILAYPANYRKSGVMTFMIGKDGIIYEKNLGEGTVEEAQAIQSFDPDETWSVVQ